jgi:hypothetical protein
MANEGMRVHQNLHQVWPGPQSEPGVTHARVYGKYI